MEEKEKAASNHSAIPETMIAGGGKKTRKPVQVTNNGGGKRGYSPEGCRNLSIGGLTCKGHD